MKTPSSYRTGLAYLTSADINKTGDAEADFFSGQNAAVAVTTQGQLTLSEATLQPARSAATAFSSGRNLRHQRSRQRRRYLRQLFASARGRGRRNAGLHRRLARHRGKRLTLRAAGGDGSVSLTPPRNGQGSALIQSLSGNNHLTLTGMQLVTDPVIAGGAMLTLTLREGASFTGSLGGSLPARANVDLDETSTLTLTGDAYVTALVNADVTHQNIQSNGFYLYYDSNAPENEYLNGQSYLLPGGGFIAPII